MQGVHSREDSEISRPHDGQGRLVLLLSFALLVAGLPTSARADGGDAALIHACVQQGSQQVRIVAANDSCRTTETPVHWGATVPKVSSQPLAITVNCNAGQTVAAALAKGTRTTNRLTITVVGVCGEAVTIARDDVTLRGASTGDGLTAPSATSTVLTVLGQRVVLDQLTLAGGSRGLAALRGASFVGSNLRVGGASNAGVLVQASIGALVNPIIDGGLRDGLQVNTGGSAQVVGGVIGNNASIGVHAENGGHVVLVNGAAIQDSGFIGGLAGLNSSIQLDGIAERNGGGGLHAFTGGSVRLTGSGAVSRDNGRFGITAGGGNAHVDNGAQVVGNQDGGILVGPGGTLTLQNAATIEANHRNGIEIDGGGAATFGGGGPPGVIVRGNAGDGIRIRATGVAIFYPDNVGNGTTQVTGNGGFGIVCDPMPAVAQIRGPVGTVNGNAAGEIACPSTP